MGSLTLVFVVFGAVAFVGITVGTMIILRMRKQHRERMNDLRNQIRYYENRESIINSKHF